MASSCGIHIDHRRFHLVALDGSVKKHKISARFSGQVAPGEDPVVAVSTALRRVAKENKLRSDSVQLAVDSGLAAFRTLTLPFDDRAKIEEVIKFEVENDFPQWDIEDVVVDFLMLSTKPGIESNLLVTAIPKQRLERQLAACERAGLESSDAELDGTALFTAAQGAGLLAEDSSQILVHVGDASTTVVVAAAGKLVSMRAIRAGALPPLPALFETPEVEEADEERAEEPEVSEEEAEVLQQRVEQTAQRIRRELGRTITAVQSDLPIEAIYLCGHRLLSEETLFDVPVLPLEAVIAGAEEPIPDELVVAYGAALSALGGSPLKPHLRREELRFTGKFERLELPMAVFSLLLFTLLAVQYIVVAKQMRWRDEGVVGHDPPRPGDMGDMQLWLQYSNSYLLPDPETGWPGRLKNPPKELADFIERAERGEIDTLTKFEEIQRIRFLLSEEIKKIKRELGQVSDIKQPQSALQGMLLVMGIITDMGDQVGRYGIRSLSADYRQGRSGSPDTVEVKLDMDFFGEDSLAATRAYKAMQNALEAESWCVEFAERPTNPLDGGKGISVDGITVEVNVDEAMAKEQQT